MTRSEAITTATDCVRKNRGTVSYENICSAIDTYAALGLIKLDEPDPIIEEWLKPGSIVPVSFNTVSTLVREVQRLRASALD